MPEGAIPLENPVGTAPCFLSEDVGGRGFVVCLPGVPRELAHMMEHKVVPLLIDRIGGVRVTKVLVLRTCAVGESNIDRGIGDLMTLSNPSVGLAAHAGQTDVRIAAKADTEAEVDALIWPMEETLRERLGVAIYGVGKVTVAEVVGALIEKAGLTIGVADTLTQGQVVRDLTEAGFGDLVANDLNSDEAVSAMASEAGSDEEVSGALAEKVAANGGLGLALIGPFQDGSTMISLRGPNGIELDERGRNFQDTDHIKRWIVIQGLDKVRRVLLGQMESPVDWI